MGDTKQRILAVPLVLFAQNGFSAVSIRDICKEEHMRILTSKNFLERLGAWYQGKHLDHWRQSRDRVFLYRAGTSGRTSHFCARKGQRIDVAIHSACLGSPSTSYIRSLPRIFFPLKLGRLMTKTTLRDRNSKPYPLQ